jgi:hypothetical protein
MSTFPKSFRDEVCRLARKKAKAAVALTRKPAGATRSALADLKRRVAALEKRPAAWPYSWRRSRNPPQNRSPPRRLTDNEDAAIRERHLFTDPYWLPVSPDDLQFGDDERPAGRPADDHHPKRPSVHQSRPRPSTVELLPPGTQCELPP